MMVHNVLQKIFLQSVQQKNLLHSVLQKNFLHNVQQKNFLLSNVYFQKKCPLSVSGLYVFFKV